MFTHRNIQDTNERGALMIEAIALLGLMTMMSPMVVRQTADRTSEMEEVTIAGQMKELKDALNNYISANYSTLANSIRTSDLDHRFTVTAVQLAPYLSADLIEGNNFRGNKFMSDFKVGIRAQCTEMRRTDGTAPAGVTTSGGVITAPAPTADQYWSRYRMTGVVLSEGDELDDRRAARIASMIGADGGSMRSSRIITALGYNGNAAEKQKILGTQGVWEGDVSHYFAVGGNTGINTDVGGRVAATTTYSSGFSGDYLYRKPVDGLPDANSMFTDLDMGGATNCNGAGCHTVNNAGGLEVVGGRILIRSRNNAQGTNDMADDNGLSLARIALDTANVNMGVTSGFNMAVRSYYANGAVNQTPTQFQMTSTQALMSSRGAAVQLNATQAQMSSGGASVQLNASRAQMGLGTSLVHLSGTQANVAGGADAYVRLSNSGSGSVYMKGANSEISLDPGYAEMYSDGSSVGLWSSGFGAYTGGGQILMDDSDTYIERYNGEEIHLSNNNIKIKTTHSATNLNNTAFAVNVSRGTSFSNLNTTAFNLGVATNTSTFGINQTMSNLSVGSGRFYSSMNAGGDGLAKTIAKSSDLAVISQTNLGNAQAQMSVSKHESFSSSFTLSDGQFNLLLNSSDTRPIHNSVLTEHGLKMFSRDTSGNLNASPTISLNAKTGRVSGTVFQPEDTMVIASNGQRGGIVRQRLQVVENASASGYTLAAGSSGSLVNASNNADASVIYSNLVQIQSIGGTTYNLRTYEDHAYTASGNGSTETNYNRYRVDPAFVSVMNDIKLTSRGGARLSEAMPNYILKGIYQLTNSYTAGPWPCVQTKDETASGGSEFGADTSTQNGTCTFSLPRYSLEQLGLGGGGWEFRCPSSGHPIQNGGGSCNAYGSDGNGYVTFNYYRSGYKECPNNSECWAHPFMGMVPAPGRTISHTYVNSSGNSQTEYLGAEDEGACPNGYTAVMTLTPSVFDSGRVLAYDFNKIAGSSITRYNPGYLDYSNSLHRNVASILQPATGVFVRTKEMYNSSGYIKGWKVAMGTYTLDINGNYAWNVGGVIPNTMSAIAHTYCYFNPYGFQMPNMQLMNTKTGGRTHTSLDNPMLNSY